MAKDKPKRKLSAFNKAMSVELKKLNLKGKSRATRAALFKKAAKLAKAKIGPSKRAQPKKTARTRPARKAAARKKTVNARPARRARARGRATVDRLRRSTILCPTFGTLADKVAGFNIWASGSEIAEGAYPDPAQLSAPAGGHVATGSAAYLALFGPRSALLRGVDGHGVVAQVRERLVRSCRDWNHINVMPEAI